MKVVHLIWALGCGGSETMLVDIANEQSSVAKVFVIIGNAVIDPSILSRFSSNVTVKCLGRPVGSRNPWYIIRLYTTLLALAPDIVHAHLESFIRVLRLLRLPKVLTVHNTGIKLSEARTEYRAVYAISEAVRCDLEKRYPDTPVTLIHNGINCASIAQKSSYGGQPFKVVQVSRLDHVQKGQDVLLRAVLNVTRELGLGTVTVDFIGDGPSRGYLMSLAAELGIESCCRFLGKQTREYIYRNLHTYDLLVQPSRFEGFGLAVVEAMAARVPVLVSAVEGPMEIVGAGEYGYHFTSEDADECAMRILEIIEASRIEGFSQMQARNAEYARVCFDISRTANRYYAEYRSLCGI